MARMTIAENLASQRLCSPLLRISPRHRTSVKGDDAWQLPVDQRQALFVDLASPIDENSMSSKLCRAHENEVLIAQVEQTQRATPGRRRDS